MKAIGEVAARVLVGVAMVGVLAGAGAAANRVAEPVWAGMKAKEPALRVAAEHGGNGGASVLAVLGGWRGLVADGLWLKVQARWEARDLVGVQALVRAVSAIDPRSRYFWQNGARIVAYDFPAWRIEAAGGYDVVPMDEQRRIVREQAWLALAHVAAALAVHPCSAELWIERANIENVRLRDFAAAAESYRRAAELNGAPYYAARLHAEMLRRLGRKVDALAWLVKLHPTLPHTDEAAADVVLARIREWEAELGVAEASAYVAEKSG